MVHATWRLTPNRDTSQTDNPIPFPPSSSRPAWSEEATVTADWIVGLDTADQPPQPRTRRRWYRYFLLLVGLCVAVIAAWAVQQELLTSTYQSRYLAALAQKLTFRVGAGPSPSVRFPTTGPYNRRLGYTNLPAFLERLMAAGTYMFESQARLSPRLQQIIDAGLFPIYREKTQAGLHILDRHGGELFAAQYPNHIYAAFDAIPDRIVQTLLFLENRELLDPNYPNRNPAVEWDRFAKALLDRAIQMVKTDHRAAGGSTLATQIEKFRHSPQGRTVSGFEKLRQMASASTRAYLQGERTFPAQQQIILDYMNAIPLAAIRGYGEVHGLGDGLSAWYRANFKRVNRLLSDQFMPLAGETLPAQALAYKQVLSLFIAHRRPSFYLLENPHALLTHTNIYLKMLSDAGVISTALRDAALPLKLAVQQQAPLDDHASFATRKGINLIRTDLLTRLGLLGLYDLDRLDLVVQSTLDKTVQEEVAKILRQLQDATYVVANGLRGKWLLGQNEDPSKVHYSLVLYERGQQANLLRVHTDNVDQPFDINTGVKLDLGSTAKLRTLITYLQIVADLHEAYAALPASVLRMVQVHTSDRLTRWGLDYLMQMPNATLAKMVDAAMSRPYSASPYSRFFTGGGLHTFANFNAKDNNRILPVREAFRRSVNLVFIRMMRDIVRYYMFRVPGSTARILEDRQHPDRQAYLSRFADHEGRIFVHRFYRKYADQAPADMLQHMLDGIHATPKRLATIFGAIAPNATEAAFAEFLNTHLPQSVTGKGAQALYEQYVMADFSWADRGYLAHLHPLELWVVAYLQDHPETTWRDLVEASAGIRQEVYGWLFKTRYKHAQDRRIRTMLESEAFQEIHKTWQRLGYAFASLVPSYATAIGSSADRPDSLAELMGIIANNGVRLPQVRITQLHFAAGTPYDTTMTAALMAERVMAPEIAAVVKQALFDVVQHGTGRRIRGVFKQIDGSAMQVGGKTGTGDHRYKRYSSNATLIESRAMNRTAVFMFIIDDRFFGTLTAYVPGADAEHYHFTSSLPVQVLKLLAPALHPLLHGQRWSPVVLEADRRSPATLRGPL
ncbi:MAG: transglycosylase domain-containing protein [Candidatus Tectomicrobia bacterium]